MSGSIYFCIDQKSFFATVECVARDLDPMTTKLVVADPERSSNTLCLAITPAMKALGIQNRCRVRDIPPYIEYITAPPRMQLYIDCAAAIHKVLMKYVAPEDIHVYSIDESFLDMTPYLKLYGLPPRELARMIMQDIKDTVGTISTCGIGTNLYLCKVALDLLAKHDPEGIAFLDERSYRDKLWKHKPITDFWRVSHGTAGRLSRYGITTMQQVAECREDLLYNCFGIDAELLIDHAWGRESTKMSDIKNYRSKSKSMSSGQVLMRDYTPKEALVIVKEMCDNLCLDMVSKKVVTQSVSLYVGYSHAYGTEGAKGTVKLSSETNAYSIIVPAVAALYQRIINPSYAIRRIGLCCHGITSDQGAFQLNMFEDTTKQVKAKAIQETILEIKAKYGKNSILKGMNYEEAATGRERNMQIGGHRK